MRTDRLRPVAAFSMGVVACMVVVAVLQGWGAAAAGDGDDATFVPVSPCRLFDFRPPPTNVGPRTSPLGPGEIYTQQVTGVNGECSIPAAATTVSMNVTIVQPTATSHLRVYPADLTTVPRVSSLNWVAGQANTPNKVDVMLSPGGAIKLYNRFGSVYVLADVTGYYTDRVVDQLEARLATLESRSRPVVREVWNNTPMTLGSLPAKVLELDAFTAPAAGRIVFDAGVRASASPVSEMAYCAILPTSANPDLHVDLYISPSAMAVNGGSAAGSRSVAVAAGETARYALWCAHTPVATGASVSTRNLVMTYLPT